MEQITIGYRNLRRIIAKPPTYEALVNVARTQFDIPGRLDLSLRLFPKVGSDVSIELLPGAYYAVENCAYVAFDTYGGVPNSRNSQRTSSSDADRSPPVELGDTNDFEEHRLKENGHFHVYRLVLENMNTGQAYYAKVKPSATIAELRAFIAEKSGIPYNLTGLFYIGRLLKDDGTVVGQSCISTGDTIYFGSIMSRAFRLN